MFDIKLCSIICELMNCLYHLCVTTAKFGDKMYLNSS